MQYDIQHEGRSVSSALQSDRVPSISSTGDSMVPGVLTYAALFSPLAGCESCSFSRSGSRMDKPTLYGNTLYAESGDAVPMIMRSSPTLPRATPSAALDRHDCVRGLLTKVMRTPLNLLIHYSASANLAM